MKISEKEDAFSPDASSIGRLLDHLGSCQDSLYFAATDTLATGSSIAGRMEEYTGTTSPNTMSKPFYAVHILQQAEDTLSTDLRILISIVDVLLIVVHCTIYYSITNTRCSFLKTV